MKIEYREKVESWNFQIGDTSFKFKVLHKDNSEQWDAYVTSHPHSYLYHSSDYIETLSFLVSNNENLSIMVVNECDQIVGVLPIVGNLSTKQFFIPTTRRYSQIGFLLIFGGPLFDIEQRLFEEVIFLLFEKIREKFCKLYLKVTIDYDFCRDTGLFKSKVYDRVSFRTGTIRHLDKKIEIEKTWKDLRTNHRRMISRAQKNKNLNFRFATANDFESYYELHIETYARSSLPPHPKRYFEEIFMYHLKNRNNIIGCVEMSGRLIACVNYGVWNQEAHFWTGAASKEAYHLGANHFCHWMLIKQLLSSGVSRIYLGEIFESHKDKKVFDIGHFKSGFGSEQSIKRQIILRFGVFSHPLVLSLWNKLFLILK